MLTNKKIAVGLGTPTTKVLSNSDFNKKIKKTTSILKLLYEGKSLNRFEAEFHNDHCLNSTISAIGKYGIAINREWERVPCLGGKTTCKVKRYWLASTPDNLEKAQKVLSIVEASNE